MDRSHRSTPLTDSTPIYDVVIVGGGTAGLSGALMLGRARRSVLVVDSQQPRNAPAAHVHGFLSRDGIAPGELLDAGRREVRDYGGEIIPGRALSAAIVPDGFVVVLEDGRTLHGRRLLVATGLTDELPNIPGIRQRWGRDVLHCPYCHGWEFRDQPIGVLATGPFAVPQALLFRQWTSDLILFLHTETQPTIAEREKLAARDISVIEGEVASLVVTDDRLTGIELRTGTVIPRRALAVAPRFNARAELLVTLGLAVSEHPSGAGAYVAADATGRIAVPGVWVAGNVTDVMAQVVGAAASAALAAAAINADLIAEEEQRALTARQDQGSFAPAPSRGELAIGVPRHRS